MKKIIGVILVVALCVGMFVGCTTNTMVREYGGSDEIKLPANTKLVDIEWNDTGLWYMTKPMTENDIAETYTFQERSSYGVMEGKVTIIETKER